MRKEGAFTIISALFILPEFAQAFVSSGVRLSKRRLSDFDDIISRRATISKDETSQSSSSSSFSGSDDAKAILDCMQSVKTDAVEYANLFGLDPSTEGAFYALFLAIRLQDFVRQQKPFVLRHEEVQKLAWAGEPVNWPGFFGMNHLEQALEDDFLDAARGSTNNREGWKITDVSVPRGDSFEEARMTYDDVQSALEKGTVIFNAAGAHIPKLAGPTLACTDATWLPCALNLYITAAGKRTSAPPHTDKQDVVVIQSTGSKHWKVYSPPNPADKPQAEMFARGKMDDSLPLYLMETDLGCELLLETSLYPGDVLFIPAAFPHTTSTIPPNDGEADAHPATKDTSLHLTMGFDHHIWELDYLSVRRLALRRAGVVDSALGRMKDEENPYTGASNELPDPVRRDLFAELPLGLLDDEDSAKSEALIEEVTREVERISLAVDENTASKVPRTVWRETVERVRQQGLELLEVHRDMYLAALEEGRARAQEEAMTAHIKDESSAFKKRKVVMTPERVQRLSLFRVKGFFDSIDKIKENLREWSYQGGATAEGTGPAASSGATSSAAELAADWAFTMPVKVGDQVEADLGGAFFPATVTRAVNNKIFDVQYFDGDRDTNMSRSQIKLLVPPSTAEPEDEVDTSSMTPKQLKRWRKQQEKLKKMK